MHPTRAESIIYMQTKSTAVRNSLLAVTLKQGGVSYGIPWTRLTVDVG